MTNKRKRNYPYVFMGESAKNDIAVISFSTDFTSDGDEVVSSSVRVLPPEPLYVEDYDLKKMFAAGISPEQTTSFMIRSRFNQLQQFN